MNMNRMWSPWRSRYLHEYRAQHQPEDGQASIFSRMAAEDRDEENLILWRGEHVFVVINLYPYNSGHLLIVPYREVQEYEDLTTDEQIALSQTIERCIRWLKEALEPSGFNIGMNLGPEAGAGIPDHLHMHVVPRWTGDTNFMATVSETNVVPEALQETYQRLKTTIEARSSRSENGRA